MIKGKQNGHDFATAHNMQSVFDGKLWIPLYNFTLDEFKCKCGCNRVKISESLVMGLQTLRNYMTKKHKRVIRLKVTSGFRCESHNNKVGGSPKSQHLNGLASDICSPDIEVEMIYQTVQELRIFSVAIYYPEKHFIHLDVRENEQFKHWIDGRK